MRDYTYTKPEYRIVWSAADNEWVGLCDMFPSLSWVAATPTEALSGIESAVLDIHKTLILAAHHNEDNKSVDVLIQQRYMDKPDFKLIQVPCAVLEISSSEVRYTNVPSNRVQVVIELNCGDIRTLDVLDAVEMTRNGTATFLL